MDFLEELHFFDHGLDLALKVNANKGSIVAIFAHLGQVSSVFALGLNQNLFHVVLVSCCESKLNSKVKSFSFDQYEMRLIKSLISKNPESPVQN